MEYTGSTIKSFTLESFYNACDISGQGAANAAVPCNFTITGYKALSNTPVASQSFNFEPSEPVDVMQPMSEATLNPDFQQLLGTVVFTVTTPGLVSLVIDNVAGKLLCSYALRIMYHSALTVGRYHTIITHKEFHALDFTRSSPIVKKDRKSYIWSRSLHIAALYRYLTSRSLHFITIVQTTALCNVVNQTLPSAYGPRCGIIILLNFSMGQLKGPCY